MKFDRRDLLLALGVFLVALFVGLNAVPTTAFHRDEARWIHRARFVGEALNPLGPYWQDRLTTYGQPPFGSYVTGLGLLAQGRDLDTNAFYDFNYSEAWNRRHGAMPNELDLLAARRANSVLGALIVACAYLIARGLTNRVAGVVAAAALIPHPLWIYLSSLAGSDALLTLTIALSVMAAMALAERPTWWRAFLLALAIGVGASTKLSPLAMSVPLAALGVAYLAWAWRDHSPDRARVAGLGWRLLPQPAIAYAVFVVSYPYLWPDPIGRTLTLFRFRAKEMANQGAIWPELNVAGPADALSRIGNWLGGPDTTTGQLAGTVAALAGTDWRPPGIDLPLAVAGTVVLAALVVRHGLASRHALAAAILGGQVALIVVGMRADFARYLLPVVLTEAVCIGVFGGAVWTLVREWALRRATESARTEASAAEPVASAS